MVKKAHCSSSDIDSNESADPTPIFFLNYFPFLSLLCLLFTPRFPLSPPFAAPSSLRSQISLILSIRGFSDGN